MRLPWLSRRSTGQPTGGAAVAPAAPGDGTQSTPLSVRRSEWRDVGTLRPSFRADPGVRIQRFRDGLAGSQLPDPILRPLGHERSADGPAGLVTGLTRPVIARITAGAGGSQSLPLAHRRAPVDTQPVAEPGDAPVMAALPAPDIRHAPVVTDAPVVARSLTSAGPADRRIVPGQTASALQRSAVTPMGAPMPLTLAQPAATPGTGTIVGSSPTSRTILRSAGRSRVRLGPPIGGDTTVTTTAGQVGGPDQGAAPSGAPAVGATQVVSHAATDAPLTGSLRPSAGAQPLTTVASPADGGDDGTWTAPGGLLLARVATATASESPTGDTGDPVMTPRSGTAPATRWTPDAPLVGSDPLSRTTWPLGDPAAGRPPREPAPVGSSAPVGSPVQVRAATAVQALTATPAPTGRATTAGSSAGGGALTSPGTAIQRSTASTSRGSDAAPAMPYPTSWAGLSPARDDLATRHPGPGPVPGMAALDDRIVGQETVLPDSPATSSQGAASTTVRALQRSPTMRDTFRAAPSLVLARAASPSSGTTQPGDAPRARDGASGPIDRAGILAVIQREGESPAASPSTGNQPTAPSSTAPGSPGAASEPGDHTDRDAQMLKMQQEVQRLTRLYDVLSNIIRLQRERSGQVAANLRG